jgi:hypothetical protein
MMNDADTTLLMDELDAILREAPPELSEDLGAELLSLVQEHRSERSTERPGAA